MNVFGTHEIPEFRTHSYRGLRIDWHEIDAYLIDIMDTESENAAIDTFIVKTCKNAKAKRRRKSRKHKDPESSWVTVQTAFNLEGKRMQHKVDIL